MSMKQMMPVMMLVAVLSIGGVVYAVQGVNMHAQVQVEEVAFNDLQQSYWTQSKAVRDAAETGSQLNEDLARLQQYPSQLMLLKLVGVGKILTGIFGVLLAILVVLFMMPFRIQRVLRNLHYEMEGMKSK